MRWLVLMVFCLVACDERASAPMGGASAVAVSSFAPSAGGAVTPLPGAFLEGFAIELPSDGELAVANLTVTLDTASYQLVIGRPNTRDRLQDTRAALEHVRGFRSFVVDEQDGFILEREDKQGSSRFLVSRYLSVAGGRLYCNSSTVNKPLASREAALEAYRVCGTLRTGPS